MVRTFTAPKRAYKFHADPWGCMEWSTLQREGVIEHARGRTRITPKFMAHAEGTAGRMKLLNPAAPLMEVINMALYSWNPRLTAHSGDLLEFMQDRNQLGLMPMYA